MAQSEDQIQNASENNETDSDDENEWWQSDSFNEEEKKLIKEMVALDALEAYSYRPGWKEDNVKLLLNREKAGLRPYPMPLWQQWVSKQYTQTKPTAFDLAVAQLYCNILWMNLFYFSGRK